MTWVTWFQIIYIARNPKDVCVSFYHYVRYLFPVTRYKGEFKEFFKLFLEDKGIRWQQNLGYVLFYQNF